MRCCLCSKHKYVLFGVSMEAIGPELKFDSVQMRLNSHVDRDAVCEVIWIHRMANSTSPMLTICPQIFSCLGIICSYSIDECVCLSSTAERSLEPLVSLWAVACVYSMQARNGKLVAVMLKVSKEGSDLFLVHRPNTGLQSRTESIKQVLKKYSKVNKWQRFSISLSHW